MNDNNLNNNQTPENNLNTQNVNQYPSSNIDDLNAPKTISSMINQSPLNENIQASEVRQEQILNQPSQGGSFPFTSNQDTNNVSLNDVSLNTENNNINGVTGDQTMNNVETSSIEKSTQPTLNNISQGGNNLPPTESKMDDSFVEPKKKPIALIIIMILLVLIIAGCAIYYFVLDNPQKLFLKTYDNALSLIQNGNTEEYEQYNYEYSIDLDIISNNQEEQYIYDILNDLTFSGNIGYSKTDNQGSIILNTLYKDNQLPSIQMLLELEENGNSYIYLKDLYSQVLKVESTSEISEEDIDINSQDYQIVLNSFTKAVRETLENAKYTKEYTKVDNENVKKITVDLDKKFKETVITKLLNDEKFIESYASIYGTTPEELTDSLNETLSNLNDDITKVSIYLSIFNNEFIKLEIDDGEKEQIELTKKESSYHFEYSENYTLVYQSDLTINKLTEEEIDISLNIDNLEEEISFKFNLNSKIDTTKGVDKLSTDNAVLIDDLTEDDIYEILLKLFENDGIMELLEDTGLDDYLMGTEDPTI